MTFRRKLLVSSSGFECKPSTQPGRSRRQEKPRHYIPQDGTHHSHHKWPHICTGMFRNTEIVTSGTTAVSATGQTVHQPAWGLVVVAMSVSLKHAINIRYGNDTWELFEQTHAARWWALFPMNRRPHMRSEFSIINSNVLLTHRHEANDVPLGCLFHNVSFLHMLIDHPVYRNLRVFLHFIGSSCSTSIYILVRKERRLMRSWCRWCACPPFFLLVYQ
jgi:hypothetical protein